MSLLHCERETISLNRFYGSPLLHSVFNGACDLFITRLDNAIFTVERHPTSSSSTPLKPIAHLRGNVTLISVDFDRNLGVIFDKHRTFSNHTSALPKSCLYLLLLLLLLIIIINCC